MSSSPTALERCFICPLSGLFIPSVNLYFVAFIMWWALGIEKKISYSWSFPWRTSIPRGGHSNLPPSFLTLIKNLLWSGSELSPTPVILKPQHYPQEGAIFVSYIRRKWRPKVSCPRVYNQEVTGWDRTSGLFDFCQMPVHFTTILNFRNAENAQTEELSRHFENTEQDVFTSAWSSQTGPPEEY